MVKLIKSNDDIKQKIIIDYKSERTEGLDENAWTFQQRVTWRKSLSLRSLFLSFSSPPCISFSFYTDIRMLLPLFSFLRFERSRFQGRSHSAGRSVDRVTDRWHHDAVKV